MSFITEVISKFVFTDVHMRNNYRPNRAKDDKSMIYTRPKSNGSTRSAACLHDTAGAHCHVVCLVVLVTNTGISDGTLKMANNQPAQDAVKGGSLYPYFSDF